MCPYIGNVDMYKLFINIGTVVAGVTLIIMIFLNTKSITRSGVIVGVFAVSMLGSLIGGQFLKKLTFWRWSSYDEFIANITKYEGTHFLGRIIIAIIFFVILWHLVIRKKEGIFSKYGLSKSLDIISFFMVIQHFFNRLGCLMRGCCYGKPHYGIFSIHLLTTGIDYPVYPTQTFEILGMTLLLIYMSIKYIKNKDVFPHFCIGYGIIIFVSEFLMDQIGTRLFLGLSFIQLAAIVLVMLGIVYKHEIKLFKKSF